MARIAKKAGYHHGDLRRALVAAARKIIETKGPAALTLRGAAQLAGVSVAAPYRHFADKDTLLAAVLAEGFEQLALDLSVSRANARTPEQDLIAVGNGYIAYAVANASIYRLMFGPTIDKEKHPELREAGMKALGQLLDAVKRCHEQGLFVRGAKVEELALGGWALCHGLASLHTDGALGPTLPVEVHSTGDRLIHFLLHGMLKPR